MPKTTTKTKRKTEAHTAASLVTPASLGKRDARARVLDALLALALEGNVAAAKLYLDWTRENEPAPEALSVDEAIRLLREMNSSEDEGGASQTPGEETPPFHPPLEQGGKVGGPPRR